MPQGQDEGIPQRAAQGSSIDARGGGNRHPDDPDQLLHVNTFQDPCGEGAVVSAIRMSLSAGPRKQLSS